MYYDYKLYQKINSELINVLSLKVGFLEFLK